ncbi:MAG TPA: outer membrane beta-barrel protein [Gammaproteobacteria bacterium]|nr:outer membrane beta-barrel protein [Gammaproteobacteria bacterium]
MITFNRSAISIILGFCSLSIATPVLASNYKGEALPQQTLSGFYLGGFGGYGALSDFQVRQSGVAMFSTTLNDAGIGSLTDPLAIDAEGDSDSNSVGFGGLHFGYAWSIPAWNMTPAIELEGLYFSKTYDAFLDSSSIVLANHDFDDSFPTKAGVVLVNGIFQLDYFRLGMLHPYVGVGLGAAILSISGAESPQVNPPEPNINHFNSDQNSSDWAFAAQAKLGFRFDLSEHWDIFAEYRFLYLGNTEFTFGSTSYPTHVPTTSWKVDFDNMYMNSGVLGLEYKV